MNVIDNAALAQNIKDGIAQAQAAGLALEDHLPSIVQAAVDAELAKVEKVIESALSPLLARIDAANATLTAAVAEAEHWRALFASLPIQWQPTQNR